MLKKMIGMAAVAMLAIGAFVVTKANAADDNKIALADLLKVNVANAECEIRDYWLDGKCLMVGECVWDPGATDCSWGW